MAGPHWPNMGPVRANYWLLGHGDLRANPHQKSIGPARVNPRYFLALGPLRLEGQPAPNLHGPSEGQPSVFFGSWTVVNPHQKCIGPMRVNPWYFFGPRTMVLEGQPTLKQHWHCTEIMRAKLARTTSWNPHKNYGGYAGACRLGGLPIVIDIVAFITFITLLPCIL